MTEAMIRRWVSALAGPTRLMTVATLSLVFSGCLAEDPSGTGQDPPTPSPEVTFETKEELPSEVPGGLHERIDLSGHWTIEVSDPDGTVVTRRETEGTLSVARGNVALSNMQGRAVTSALWAVELLDRGSDHPCVAAARNLTPTSCLMTERTSILEATNRSLVASVPASGSNAHKLVIKGNLVAQRSGTIDTMLTSAGSTYWRCAASLKYSGDCDAGPLDDITVTPLDPSLSVHLSQRLEITVVVILP